VRSHPSPLPPCRQPSARRLSRRPAAKNGVVIATEKKLPSVLIDETSMQKILMLTENIAIVRARPAADCAAPRQ
jgi:type II secretory pathway component PulC